MNLVHLLVLSCLFLVGCDQSTQVSESEQVPNENRRPTKIETEKNHVRAEEDAYHVYLNSKPSEARRLELLEIGRTGGMSTFKSGGMSTREYYLRDGGYDLLPHNEQRILMEGFNRGWREAEAKAQNTPAQRKKDQQ